MPAAYIQVHLRLDFIMEAITMTLIRLLPSDMGSYCLQYRIPNYISRRESSGQKSWLTEELLTLGYNGFRESAER